MQPRLTLVEHATTRAVPLTTIQRDALRRRAPGLRLEPSAGGEGRYDLTPDQWVGIVALPGLTIEIRPKAPVSTVLFMLSFACGLARWDDAPVTLDTNDDLVELMALLLARATERATHRGLLTGYRTEDVVLAAPRGRILFDRQVRRFGLAPPIEVRRDEFTADILENQLLLAALTVLGRAPIRAESTSRELRRAQRAFGSVTLVEFAPGNVPDLAIHRLNRHYEPALRLAILVLRASSLELGAGRAPTSSGFLFDMNVVFERFVRTSLREALGVDGARMPERSPPLWLDQATTLLLKPDLCLLDRDLIVWVGDVKYKLIAPDGHESGDVYQLVAYTTALDLSCGTLVYVASGRGHVAEHVVVPHGQRLRLVALDLSVGRPALRRQIDDLARWVRQDLLGGSTTWAHDEAVG